MADWFTRETWASRRQMLIFRWLDGSSGLRWTFCVSRFALEELYPDGDYDADAAFERSRAAIYRAAAVRMFGGDPSVQHVLTAREIRDSS